MTAEVMSKQPAIDTWNQHPVISTVLWILGTAPGSSDSKDPSNCRNIADSTSGGGGMLKWKDEKGGNINEIISHPAQTESTSSAPAESKEDTLLVPCASRELSQQSQQQQSSQDYDPYLNGDYTPSPQWGFYVPITPPQQEMFAQQQQQQKLQQQQKQQMDDKNRNQNTNSSHTGSGHFLQSYFSAQRK
mmetsp:Transcript_31781/g.53610  ORF Transcript_31781/g.53610 Transcript_31781/m.53610 type:complete len:189 (-) Transcript_31781:684-1250(-)|eukprot:CAMPEP_0174979300 /NCGR_PEP_ID=MMETSP0004_2-20121128/14696_1 /TAXON_ID=420556 /ORGANISM="Ochromonas sp., Strain CCMP1393" /LENGTH=188 /DNA_ID=CAMNT_0016230795 /DNA_START=80 /DNA_END=646 /DNA_ORIENTATION=+